MNKKTDKMKTDIKNRIKRNTALLACTLIFLCVTISGVIPVQLDSEAATDFVSGFQVGLLSVLFVAFAANLTKYRKALQDEKQLTQLYYKENDERMCYINQQVGKSSMSIVTVVLVISAIISGYFDITVFLTILAVTFVQAIIQIILKSYYTKCISGDNIQNE